MERRKIIKRVLITLLFAALVQTPFYQIVVLLLGVCSLRKWIKKKITWKWGYASIVCICVLGLWVTSPRIRWNTNDRIRLVYQDKNNTPVNMPLHHWSLNTLIPEPEAMNVGLPVVRYVGKIIPGGVGKIFGLSGGLIDQFVNGQSIRQFKEPFRHLEYSGQFVGSGVVSQVFNSLGGDTKATYVISPKDYDKEKTYPVVVWLHGYLGNWQFHQGVMLGLDDHIVLSPSTHSLNGEWSRADIEDVVTNQLSLLENLGYKIDRKRIHLIGCSNGAYYGSSEAVRHFSKYFRSVTFLVGSSTAGKHHRNEMHIYGRDDTACPAYLKKHEEKKSTGKYLYFPCCGHYLMAYHAEEIREWYNERLHELDAR